MAEDFKFQLSVKLPGSDPKGYRDSMLNIKADSFTEFLENVNAFLDTPEDDIVAAIAAAEVNLKAASVAAQGLSTSAVSPVAGGDEAQQTTANADPVPAALQEAFKDMPRDCVHGQRQFREGRSAKGPWAGLFCPLPKERKAEQCSAEFGNLKK